MVRCLAEIKRPSIDDDGLVSILRGSGMEAFDERGNIVALGGGFARHTGGAVLWALRDRLVENERYEDAAFLSSLISAYSERFEQFDERADWSDIETVSRLDLVREYHEAAMRLWLDGGPKSFDENGLLDGQFGLDVLRKSERIFANMGLYRAAAKCRSWCEDYVSSFGDSPRGGRLFALDPGNRPEDMLALQNHHERRIKQSTI